MRSSIENLMHVTETARLLTLSRSNTHQIKWKPAKQYPSQWNSKKILPQYKASPKFKEISYKSEEKQNLYVDKRF